MSAGGSVARSRVRERWLILRARGLLTERDREAFSGCRGGYCVRIDVRIQIRI